MKQISSLTISKTSLTVNYVDNFTLRLEYYQLFINGVLSDREQVVHWFLQSREPAVIINWREKKARFEDKDNGRPERNAEGKGG